MNVQARLEEIRKAADRGDNEMAHSLRDNLYRDALLEISEGEHLDEAQDLAQYVLEAEEIEFSVWCA